MKIYFCARRQLYFGQPCEQHPASVTYGHPDIDVSDALTLDDLDSHDLGYDLAEIRYAQRGRNPLRHKGIG